MTGSAAALLDAHLMVRRDTGFRLDVTVSVAAGEVVALVGPNGAGKTTALRALAGLTPLTDGRIRVGDRALDDPTGRVWVAPEHRPVGMVFQDYLLFPHLSALENVAFGPRSRGAGRQQARASAADWLRRVGLSEYAGRKPRHLSGGQAQRVALARALVGDPTVLLLDEPLAALDARTRLETRAELHRHLSAHPGATVLVTHDPLDAFVLADRLLVVEDGVVVQQGDAATITARPQTDYVARLVGLNLYRGHASGRTVRITADCTLTVAEPTDGEVFVTFPPSAVALHRRQPDGSPRNVWQGTVSGVHRHGDNLRVQLEGPIKAAADVTHAAALQLDLSPGRQVWAAVKATETVAYPAGGQTVVRATPSPGTPGSGPPGRA